MPKEQDRSLPDKPAGHAVSRKQPNRAKSFRADRAGPDEVGLPIGPPFSLQTAGFVELEG